jgi:uncharacterized protein (DUF1800 family)
MRDQHAAIAWNRFGLGARSGDTPPPDPQRWLLDQLARYEPRPSTIASAPGSNEIAARARDYLQRIRALMDDGKGRRRPMANETSKISDDASKRDEQQAIRKAIRQQYRDGYGQQVRARVSEALSTDTPFAERLVHFWANHFAISVDKAQTIGLAGPLEFEAVRPHIAGRFIDMLQAVERHPGMLMYLDQAQSIGPNSRLAAAARRRQTQRQPGLNENLAREILELHTLGVGGGYAQPDVLELAGALSGWSVGGFVRRPLGVEAPDGSFIFQPAWHEPGTRTLLGKRYGQEGEAQAHAMLQDLAAHPATARHLATKLARHFVADMPPPALVERLAAAYSSSGGELMAMYRVLIASPESWVITNSKFKTPWDWTISALRATGARQSPDLRIVAALNELGQPVWRPGSPAGWDDVAASWAAPDALLRRVEIAGRIAAIVGDRIDARALAPQILPGVLSPATSSAIARADRPEQGLALLLVSPEFLRR